MAVPTSKRTYSILLLAVLTLFFVASASAKNIDSQTEFEDNTELLSSGLSYASSQINIDDRGDWERFRVDAPSGVDWVYISTYFGHGGNNLGGEVQIYSDSNYNNLVADYDMTGSGYMQHERNYTNQIDGDLYFQVADRDTTNGNQIDIIEYKSQNNPPQFKDAGFSSEFIKPGRPTELFADVTDPDGDSIDSVKANITQDGTVLSTETLQYSSDQGRYIVDKAFQRGNYTVKFYANDSKGSQNSVERTLNLTYPVGEYHFNETSGDLIDRSGQGINGVPNAFEGNERGYPGYRGKDYGNWGDRLDPKAWNLDGDNDYIEFGNPGVWSASSLGDTASSSIWVKFNKTDSRQRIFGHGSSPFADRWGMSIRDLDSDSEYEWTGYVNTENGAGYFSDQDSTVPVEPGKWYNVMMVYDGSEANLYINNTRVASKQITGQLAGSSSSIWTVGSRGANEYFLNASVDELMMNDRYWNSSQRKNVYDYNCPSGKCKTAGDPSVSLQNPEDGNESRNPIDFDFDAEFFTETADAELWFNASTPFRTGDKSNLDWQDGTLDGTTTENDQLTIALKNAKIGSISNLNSGSWQTLEYPKFKEPVVIVIPENTGNGNGLVGRARNVQSDTAEIRVCDSDGGGNPSCEGTSGHGLHYMVVDAATVNEVAGIEAGTYQVGGGIDSESTPVTYNENFGSTPVPLHTVQTTNGAEPTDSRGLNADSNGFDGVICNQGGEDNCDSGHPTETVGYIAVEPGNIPLSKAEAGFTGNSISNSDWVGRSFSTSFNNPPAGFAAIITDDGGQETENDEVRNIGTNSFDFRYCELDYNDDCDGHTDENIGWFAAAKGEFQIGSSGSGNNGQWTSPAEKLEGEADVTGYTIDSNGAGTVEIDFATNKSGSWEWYDTPQDLPKTEYLKYNLTLSTTTENRPKVNDVEIDYTTEVFDKRREITDIQNGLNTIEFNFDRQRIARFHDTIYDTAEDWILGTTKGLQVGDVLQVKASEFASIYSDNFGQDAENGITIPLGTSREVQEPYTKSGDTIEFNEDGKYVISYSSSYESSAPSRLIMRNYIEKNGNTITPSESRCYIRNDQTGDSCQNAATFVIQASAGDTIRMRGTKDHGDCCTIRTRQDQYLNARKLELPAAQIYDSSGTDNYDQGTKTISMDTKTFVDNELFSYNSNQNGIKVSEDGWYKVYYTANMHSISQGDRQAPLTYIRVNGQTVPANELRSTTYIRNDGDGDQNHNTASGLVQLDAGDTVQVRIEQEYTQSGYDSDVINDEAWMTMHPANSQALQVERRSSEQRISQSTWTDVNFDTINKNSDRFDYSSGSSGITIQQDGYYTIDYTFGWDDDAQNNRHRVYSRLTKNGNEVDATRSRDYTRGCCTAGRTNSMSHTVRMYLQQGDTLRLQGYSSENFIDVDEGDTYLTISPGIKKNEGTYESQVIEKDEEGIWSIQDRTVSGNPEIDYAANTTGSWEWYDNISDVPETRYLKYNITLSSQDSVDRINIGNTYDEIFETELPVNTEWNIRLIQDDGQSVFAPNRYDLKVLGVDKPEINNITTTPSEGSIGYNDVVDIQADVTESTKANEDVDEVWADVYEGGDLIAKDVDLTDSNGDNIYEADGVYQQDRANTDYNIEVFANNTLEGLRVNSTTRRFNDNQIPTATFISPDLQVSKPYIDYTINATDNNAVDSALLYFNGSTYSMRDKSGDKWGYNLTGLSEGTYDMYGSATDIGGNTKTTKSVAYENKLPNWELRKKLLVKEQNGQKLTDYPIDFTLQKEPEMNADYSDLRFYYINSIGEQQEIDYWIQSSDGSQARVWMEIPELPAGGEVEVLMYYGNDQASSKSNGDEVFKFFDNFEDGQLDSNKWSWTDNDGGSSYTEENGKLKITANGADWWDTTENNNVMEALTTPPDSFEWVSKTTHPNSGDSGDHIITGVYEDINSFAGIGYLDKSNPGVGYEGVDNDEGYRVPTSTTTDGATNNDIGTNSEPYLVKATKYEDGSIKGDTSENFVDPSYTNLGGRNFDMENGYNPMLSVKDWDSSTATGEYDYVYLKQDVKKNYISDTWEQAVSRSSYCNGGANSGDHWMNINPNQNFQGQLRAYITGGGADSSGTASLYKGTDTGGELIAQKSYESGANYVEFDQFINWEQGQNYHLTKNYKDCWGDWQNMNGEYFDVSASGHGGSDTTNSYQYGWYKFEIRKGTSEDQQNSEPSVSIEDLEEKPQTFTVDLTSPNITSITVSEESPDGRLVDGETVDITAELEEKNPLDTVKADAQFAGAGEFQLQRVSLDENTYVYEGSFQVNRSQAKDSGQYQIDITAKDKAGNVQQNSSSSYLLISDPPPEASLENPPDGVTRKNPITFEYNATCYGSECSTAYLTSPSKSGSITANTTEELSEGGETTKSSISDGAVTPSQGETLTFTNCGAYGRYGATQSSCDSTYQGTNLEGEVNVVGDGIQEWTPPFSGEYTVTVKGAQGTGAGSPGGSGAIVKADIPLDTGTPLKILVGQMGYSDSTYDGAGGGGGGSFITDSNDNPLLVAGGGAGNHDTSPGDWQFGQTSTFGADSGDGAVSGGEDGNGGNANNNEYAGGGGGLLTGGEDTGQSSQNGGWAFVNGGLGGETESDPQAVGGFGGGGGAHGSSATGGGGGGYSGGAGSGEPHTESKQGGGGGSFIPDEASNVATSDGAYATTGNEPHAPYGGDVANLENYNTGHGEVLIQKPGGSGTYIKKFDSGDNNTKWTDIGINSTGEVSLSYGTNKSGQVQYYSSLSLVPSHRYLFVKAEMSGASSSIDSISVDYTKFYTQQENPSNSTVNSVDFNFTKLEEGMPEELNWSVVVEDSAGQLARTGSRIINGVEPEVDLIRPLDQATAPVDFEFSGICNNPNGCEKAEVYYNSTETIYNNFSVNSSSEWNEGQLDKVELDDQDRLVLKKAFTTGQLNYEWYDTQNYYDTNSHPNSKSEFDNFFDDSNGGVSFGGDGLYERKIFWHDQDWDAKPGYLPADGYSWKAEGYVYAPEDGTYTFGVDSDDAGDVFINGNLVVGWYGGHGTQGDCCNADYSGHTGTVDLQKGWHSIKARMEEGGGGDGIAVGWQKPSDSSLTEIPASSYATQGGSGGSGTYYDNGYYNSSTYDAEYQVNWQNSSIDATGSYSVDFSTNKTGSWEHYDTVKDLPDSRYLRFNLTVPDKDTTINEVQINHKRLDVRWDAKHTVNDYSNGTKVTVTDQFLQEDTPFTLNWNVKIYQENGISKFASQNQTIEVVDSTVYQESIEERVDGQAATDRDTSFFSQFAESMNLVENAKGIKTYIVPDFSAVVNITQGEVLADRRKRGAVTAIMNVTDATDRSFEGARVMDETVSGTFESAATALFPRNTSSESLAVTENIQDTLNEVRLLQPENLEANESADRQFEGNRLLQEISSLQSVTEAGYSGTRSTSQNGTIQTDTIIQQYAQSQEGIITTSSATRGINQVRNLIVALGRVSIDTVRSEADLERNITTSPQGDTSATRQINTRGLVSEQITAASDIYRGFFRENIRETATADTSIVDILTEVRFINPDTASVNSSATRQADITQEVSDIPTLNSAVTRAFTGDRNVSQQGEIDAEREGIGKFFYVNDSLESDAVVGEAYIGFLRQNVETVSTTDTVERPFIDITIPIIQETGTNSSATRTQDVTELIGADTAVFDSKVIRAFPRSVAQNVGVNATGEFSNLQRIRQITETITGQTNATRQADISQTITQRASVFGDTALGYFRQTEPDTVATNSSVTDILNQVQFVSEQGFLNSSVSRTAATTQEVSDIPLVSSVVDRGFIGGRNVSDNSSMVSRLNFREEAFVGESLGVNAVSEYTKIYTGYVRDDATANENIVREFESTRLVDALNDVTNTVSRSFTGSRSVIQAASGSAESYKQQYRQLDDRVKAVSSVQDTLTQVEFITESSQAKDRVERTSYIGERVVNSIPTLGDTVTRNIEANRSAQDNPEATADSIIQQYRNSVAQSNLDDSAIRRMENVRNDVVGEATLTQSVGRAFTGKRTTVEYTTLTDVMTRTTEFVRDEQEQIETEEDFIVTYGFLVEDTVQTATTVSDLLNQFRFSAEQTDIVADSDRNISGERDFQEGVDSVDEQDRRLVDERRLQEPLLADTSIDATVKNFRNLIAPAEATTAVSDLLNQVRNDNTLRVNLTADSNRTILVDRLMDAEPLEVTETMERSIDFRRTEGEAIDTTDDIYKIEYQQLQEQLDVNESAERQVRFIQDLEPSQLEIVEEQERSYKGLREPVLETGAVAELERRFVDVRELTEVVETNTEIYRGLFRDIQAQLIDVVAKEDRVLENIRVVQDNATGQEEVVRNVSWEREAQVIPVLTDLSTRSGEFSNEVSDTTNIDSSVAVGRFFYIEDQQLVLNSDVARTYFRVKQVRDAINATTGDIVFEYLPERKGQAVFSVNASTDRGFLGERTVEDIAESEDAEPLLSFASEVYSSPTMQSTLNTSTLVQDRLNTAVDTVTNTDNLLFMEGNRLFTTIAFDSNTSEQTTVPEVLQTDFAYNETVYIAYEAGQNIITGSFVEDTSSLITIRNGQVIYEPLFTEQSLPEFLQDTYVARTTQIHLFGLIALAMVLYLLKTWRDRNREIKEYKADRTGEGSG